MFAVGEFEAADRLEGAGEGVREDEDAAPGSSK